MKEKDILKNIRKNSIKGFIVFLIIAIVPHVGIYACLVTPEYKFFAIILLVFSLLFDYILVKLLITIINPLRDPVFRKYGSPKKVKEILNELNSNIVYEDDNIIMSKKYIVEKSDFSSLIAFEDVIGVHKLRHQKNFATDYYGVILTDKYGYQHQYTYRVRDEKKCDELLMITASLCKNAAIGYTKQQKQYIKENTVKLNDLELDNEMENDSDNMFKCDNCGAIVEESAKKCPECGERFDDAFDTSDDVDKKYSDLNKLKKLLDDKIITKEEFDKEKKKILNK